MSAHQLSGRAVLQTVREDLAAYRAVITPARLRVTVMRFEPSEGDPDPWRYRMEASRISAEQKVRAFSHLGFAVDHVVLPGTVSAAEFADRIDACNTDEATRAVIVQFPPPARLVPLVQRLDPAKDIDGLLGGRSLQRACATADGISRIVEPFAEGATVAVVGARGFVGSGVMRLLADRNIALLPLDQGDDLRRAAGADIVVSTAGSAHLLTPEHIRPHHRVVVDSGFSPRADGTVAGDIHPRAAPLPQNITPVPGGVGPIEMAVLMERIVRQVADPALQPWTFPKTPYLTRRASAARMRSTGNHTPGRKKGPDPASAPGPAHARVPSDNKKRGGPTR
ncbi:bifunctional 5,10-methylenetetrahydrofolate dehydrogenase/5,10-methenyltetrahydrofolate cyclohydrolase [Streptomyces mexicanus]|uniref:bifunctional 5,10-methylenetetrahydrofolate dehydrogenase/5,10-methenyltetrahydrofolate cyclohydrolase n=1 Tax=Streptomyces mexicanus TaxID=178566 RepID=UPI001F230180|nr:bifunctional 5,10-methylenetetrahydrofolate dehydrogenase/5,10-methenyltetrahydrofolate cyclohydrolase [Streptomyces mexicanus]